MMRPESHTPDRPFPGARSQVPGANTTALQADAPGAHPSARPGGPARPDEPSDTIVTLPLEAKPMPVERGWSIRLAVRAEQVTVNKDVIVRERVVVGRREVPDVAHVEDEIRREELRIDQEGDVNRRRGGALDLDAGGH